MKQPLAYLLRRSQFSNDVGTGDWSADILVRPGAMVNPQAHRRTSMSRAIDKVRAARRGSNSHISAPVGRVRARGLQVSCALLAAGVLAGLGASLAAADIVPQQIAYQGQIQNTSAVPVTKGVYIIKAQVWDNATGGSVLWGKLYPVNVDASGNFNVTLGDPGGVISPAPAYDTLGQALDGGSRFLGITILTTPAGSVAELKEIAPRMQLVSSPYSLHTGMADYALTWNGLPASQLASVSSNALQHPLHPLPATLGFDGTNFIPMPLTINSNPPALVFSGPVTINGALLPDQGQLTVNTTTLYPVTTNGIAVKNNVRMLGSLTPRAWAVPHTETTDGYLIVNWGFYVIPDGTVCPDAGGGDYCAQVWVTLPGLGQIILYQHTLGYNYPCSGYSLLPIPAGMTYTIGLTGDGSRGYPGTNWFQALGQ